MDIDVLFWMFYLTFTVYHTDIEKSYMLGVMSYDPDKFKEFMFIHKNDGSFLIITFNVKRIVDELIKKKIYAIEETIPCLNYVQEQF